MALASLFSFCQVRLMSKGWMSVTENSLTLKVGERMAHWRAHPRATASSALRVVLADFPKTD